MDCNNAVPIKALRYGPASPLLIGAEWIATDLGRSGNPALVSALHESRVDYNSASDSSLSAFKFPLSAGWSGLQLGRAEKQAHSIKRVSALYEGGVDCNDITGATIKATVRRPTLKTEWSGLQPDPLSRKARIRKVSALWKIRVDYNWNGAGKTPFAFKVSALHKSRVGYNMAAEVPWPQDELSLFFTRIEWITTLWPRISHPRVVCFCPRACRVDYNRCVNNSGIRPECLHS